MQDRKLVAFFKGTAGEYLALGDTAPSIISECECTDEHSCAVHADERDAAAEYEYERQRDEGAAGNN